MHIWPEYCITLEQNSWVMKQAKASQKVLSSHEIEKGKLAKDYYCSHLQVLHLYNFYNAEFSTI